MPLLSGLATGVKQGTRVQLGGENAGLAGGVDRAVVREPFYRMRRPYVAEACFYGFEHHVADVGAADPGARGGAPGDDLAIMSIENERATDDLAVPAGELEAVRAPAQVGRIITTLPSWLRPGRWPLCFSRSRPWTFISR